MSVLTAVDQACPYCKMLPFYQVCNVTVGDSWWLCSIFNTGFCFCSFQLQLRGEKDAVIAVDTCLFEISYNVDSLEVKGPVQLT